MENIESYAMQHEWKEQVRKTLSNLPREITRAYVASETGINAGSIYTLILRGALNSDGVFTLYLWLIEKGFMEPYPNSFSVRETPSEYGAERHVCYECKHPHPVQIEG